MSYSGHLQISSHLAEQEILTLWILFFLFVISCICISYKQKVLYSLIQ